jgi:hypothetical protein
MCPDPTTLLRLVQTAVVAFAILGGFMAGFSGLFSAVRLLRTRTVSGLTDPVNLGIAIGFLFGLLAAAGAAIVTFSS